MKTLAITLCAAVLMISFSSCTWLKEKYAKNESATVAYLSEKKTSPPKMNIEGLWYSPQWGAVVFNQEAWRQVDRSLPRLLLRQWRS